MKEKTANYFLSHQNTLLFWRLNLFFILYSAILLDLDHFKMIDDRYGHDFGDQVLVEVADLLRRNVRTQDTIGRYGGEEFIILLPDSHEKECAQVQNELGSPLPNI
jgi:diguanylate cyclase (GGDEF)-like protein